MKYFKKILSVFLLVAFIGTLVGCSNSVATSSNGKVVDISFWHLWQGAEATDVQKVVDDFNNTHPKIHVQVLGGTTVDKQLTALTGGNPPDVGYVYDNTISKWSSVGAVTDLSDYISKYKVDSKNYPAPIWKLANYNGKVYGMPYTLDSYMLYYNKDLLKAGGISTPPKTISELKQDALKLTKTDKTGNYTQVGFIADNPWLDALDMAFVFGENFYDFKTDKVTCNDQNNVNALTFQVSSYQQPYNMEKIKRFKSGFGQYESPNNPFFQKQLAFDIEGEWFPTFIKEYAPKLNYGIVPIPYPDGHPELKNGGELQAGMLYVSKASKNKEADYEFINYLTSDGPNIKFCTSKGSLPASYSALNSTSYRKSVPELQPFINTVNGGQAKDFPAVPFSKEYTDALTLEEQKAYDGTETPKQALDNVAKQIQPLADNWAKTRK